MLKVIEYHFKNKLKRSLITFFSIYAFIYILVALTMVIVKPATYVNMVTFISMLSNCLLILLFTIQLFSQDYIVLVKYSVTRKNYLIGTSIYSLLMSVMMSLITMLMCLAEQLINKIAYGSFSVENGIFEDLILGGAWYVNWLIPLAATIIGIIFAVIILKLGMYGTIIIYFGCMFSSQIILAIDRKLAPALDINLPLIIISVTAISAALLCLAYRLLYTHQIKN